MTMEVQLYFSKFQVRKRKFRPHLGTLVPYDPNEYIFARKFTASQKGAAPNF